MVLEKHPNAFYITNDIQLGDGSLVLIAGPCVIESESLVLSVAEQLKTLAGALGLPLIFKSSFDRANRTGVYSFRGVGLEKGLNILQKVKETFDVPLLTDIHESNQAAAAADVVDILQIPAFLCRQTDLILACAQTGQCVNIKKGQYMAPDDMQ
ncbi:3-deoxy-8-phosphooctulonate synthase, partial [bacterium]|nr:3-deoxy-8-phosphooctulonate synthase [bacterium]